MHLYLLGINHQTAPLELREQVAFAPADLPQLLTSIHALDDVSEAMILSTCNRTEIYYAGTSATHTSLHAWMRNHSNRSDELWPCLYSRQNVPVIEHACRVAAGLDSMILGEPQILGQLKLAFKQAQNQRTLGPRLHRLFQHAFSVAKKIRSQTSIGENATSAASAAVGLAQQVFATFDSKRALMIGAGEMIEIAASRLIGKNIGTLVIANRSEVRGRILAEKLNCRSAQLSDIPDLLLQSDIVFSSTASPDYLVNASQVEIALKKRKHRPMFMVDLSVPRDIDPRVAEFDDVFLYTVDDLHRAIGDNIESRRKAATEAEAIIASQTQAYQRETDTLEAVPVIRQLRDQSHFIKEQLLVQAQRQLDTGKPPAEVLLWLANAVANKLLHKPSIELRKAGAASDTEFLAMAQKMFGLDDNDEADDS